MQISIVVIVDAKTALRENSLKDNAYLVDNTSSFCNHTGMPGDDDFLTHVCGVCNPDGSQAEEAVLNWVSFGMSATPPTLPRNYADVQASPRPSQAIARPGIAGKMKIAHLNMATPNQPGPSVLDPFGTPIISPVGTPLASITGGASGDVVTDGKKGIRKVGPIKGLRFAAVLPHKPDAQETPVASEDVSGYIPPQLDRIYGPAVDNGVIFPAMYGSPMAKTEGWYWSASVDVSKEGVHEYCMDLTLFQVQIDADGETEWLPRTFTLTGKLAISRSVKTNGFATPAGFGVLPLPFPCQ